MNVDIVLQLLLTLWLWALIWMERGIQANWRWKSKTVVSFWEVRTFALISFLWGLSAWVSVVFQTQIFIAISVILLSLFILVYYIYGVFKEKQFWLTTEVAAIITFFLWVFVMVWFAQIAIILSIILTFILSSKPFIEKITKKVSSEELHNTIKFAVISIVILPLLPNEKFSIADLLGSLWYSNEINNWILTLSFLNPYGLWFFVVLMAGISYAWYIMSKVIWEKGSIIASGAIWWLISSTAVTASMTESSKKDTKNRDLYVVSTLIASTIMFIRVVIIVLFFNINMLSSIIYPSMFMLVWMLIYMFYFYVKSKKKNVVVDNLSFEEKKYSSPFSVWPALQFAWFVLVIKFISWVGWLYQEVWWDYFFYALWIISWLADVDAVSQTMAVDATHWNVWLDVAAITIIIAVISNNLVKGSIALKFWEKKFWREVMLWFIVSMIMWILWMVVLNVL